MKFFVVSVYLFVALSASSVQAESKEVKRGGDEATALSSLAEVVLGKNGGDKLFYFPTHDQPYTPAKYRFKYEDVRFHSADGTELHGWFLPALKGAKKAKATIVFSHGNAASIAHHFGFVSWLIPEGYNVLMYDYRGFGQSKGTITRKGMIEDVKAAFDYVASRKDVDASKLISFSHSLGGAKSIAAAAMYPIKGLRAVVSDSTFASYREMARYKAGNMGWNVTTDHFATIKYIDQIAPVPLLLIHGTEDVVVPVEQGDQLFKKAKQPKTFFRVKNAKHSNSLSGNKGEYRKQMLAWLDGVLG